MGVNDNHVGSPGRGVVPVVRKNGARIIGARKNGFRKVRAHEGGIQQDPGPEPLPGKALPYFSGAGKVIGLYEHCCHVSLLPWIGLVIELVMKLVLKLVIELVNRAVDVLMMTQLRESR